MFGIRASPRRVLQLSALAGVVSSAVGVSALSDCQTEKMLDERTLARLGRYVSTVDRSPLLVHRSNINGVGIYGVAQKHEHEAAGGLPAVRVAQVIIRSSVETLSELWWDVEARKTWDSVNTLECRLVESIRADARLVYLQGKPKRGGIVSSRDFAFIMFRVPVSKVKDVKNGALFLQQNRSAEVPASSGSIRADVNSVLLLEPIDSTTTKVSYAVEMDAKGWLPKKAVEAAADETTLMLAVMRDYVEGNESSPPAD